MEPKEVSFVVIAIAAYILIISLISVIMTIRDKSCAKKGKWRVPEKTLFILSALGGSAAMYITMKTIRHKTQHKRFMIGIPAIMVVQALLIAGIILIKSGMIATR
ncbi:MAG: DUF1294 domain-containing protein [Oscillospiraceae bacterium]|nr:DUF1294 domain-containing protein [Oscillospiraceae bacterium]